ncbi:twin arginine translocation system, TatC protein [Campylobacter subantarcticus LMG 24377]|uniref:Sec-independent protein translocase protein TatC n=2 Tax=Campylobacter subantarcticus TaxID=497724 RepID=A0A0A8HCE2_9BACT|nr:twin-arginine translocase subunit TatC [Campylobacter subantarcticus]EAJ1260626.1 twin-arginine translocase subunit TatC [Campylobacter lari]AJC90554.1 twin arginine translocation system, TatC protein [Campylobacter subantarcticus LMG 24374]AJC92314.1 twin arginine translocation system, TatC protein [Campylobacter subantarcticus LMG 24377]EAL3938537.1 twin-arginine translocase subunit TatC [Campylobacter lari]MPB99628.1 twin-arginine translocase subunit TatC [Campylobacter subantarcticus]
MFEELKPHLVELRKRLFISVACVIVMFFVCFSFNNYIIDILKAPVEAALPEISRQMTFVELQEPLFTAMKVSFFTAFLISLPVIFWQFWKFVAPGLYDNEKKLVVPFVSFASIMFALGALFCYYIVIPLAFKFLIDFGVQTQDFKPLISIGLYVGFFTKLVIAFGLAFEMPVITFFFAKLGLVDDAFLKKHFRVSVLVIFVFSAMMTPPDVISQFLMAVPLCGLYGISIYIAKKVNPSKKEDDTDE